MTGTTRTPRKRAAKPAPPEFTPGDEKAPAGVTTGEEIPQVEAAGSTSPSLSAQPANPHVEEVIADRSGNPFLSPETVSPALGESPPPGSPAAAVIAAQAPTGAVSGPVPVAAGTFAIYEDGTGGYVLVVLDPNGVESRKHIPGALVRMATGGGMVGKSLGLGKLFGGLD